MKIIYMGTPDFSVGALEALIRAGHEITAVVTQPDRPRGRSGKTVYSPVKECALKHGIPVLQPERIKRPEAVEQLRSYPAQVYVVAAFGQILSKEILDIPPYGCLNIHASLLPKYRGASPIQQAVIDGEEKSGITVMQMNEGMDTGDILYQKEIFLDKKETGESLFEKLSILGAAAITEALELLEKGVLKAVPQKEEEASHVKMLNKSSGKIDWNRPAAEIERLVRGLNSWPSAYTAWNGKQLKIWDSDVQQESSSPAWEKEPGKEQALPQPGTVCSVAGDGIGVMTGDGILLIRQLQLEGKKRMNVHDFLLGNKVECKDRFGG